MILLEICITVFSSKQSTEKRFVIKITYLFNCYNPSVMYKSENIYVSNKIKDIIDWRRPNNVRQINLKIQIIYLFFNNALGYSKGYCLKYAFCCK